jgi:hypothetical protein
MRPGVDSASNNDHQGFLLAVKAAGAWGWRPTTLVVPNVKKIRGLNLPGTHLGPCGLLWACKKLKIILKCTLKNKAGWDWFIWLKFGSTPIASFCNINESSDPTIAQLVQNIDYIPYLQFLNNCMQFSVTVEQITYAESIRQQIFNPLEQMLCTKSIRIQLLKSSEQVLNAEN